MDKTKLDAVGVSEDQFRPKLYNISDGEFFALLGNEVQPFAIIEEDQWINNNID